MKARGKCRFTAFALLGLMLLGACSQLHRMERELPEGDREFLSTVRYIITLKERKRFVSTPPEQRQAFIADFWKRRDPDRDTPENEYRDIYFSRIEEANRLFRSEGRQGWLTDRGRTYVMLGPPTRRDVYPTGYSFYEPPVEVWVYGFFPIIFVDKFRQGKYELEKYNALYLNAINSAEMKLNAAEEMDKDFLNFGLKFKSKNKNSGEISMMVPYSMMLFKKDGDLYRAAMQVDLAISDKAGQKVWNFSKEYPVSVTEEKLAELNNAYLIRIGVKLPAGRYMLNAVMRVKNEKRKAEKTLKIKIR